MKNALNKLFIGLLITLGGCINILEEKIEDEKGLLLLISENKLEYKKIYELNEIKKLSEGIYLVRIKLSEPAFKKVINKVKMPIPLTNFDPQYEIFNWKKTPSKDFDKSLFNYSPVSKETRKELLLLKKRMGEEGSYYFFVREKNYPINISLYLVDSSTQQIMIYQTYW